MKKKLHIIIREENFLSLAGNLLVALLGITGFALLARSLSTDTFGQWVLFITAGSFVDMFRFGITNIGLVRFLSGADETARIRLIGSNALISTVTTIVVAILIAVCNICFNETIGQSGYGLFFAWYPVLAFFNLPWNNALVVLQADRKFLSILLIKALNAGVFFIVLLVNFLLIEMSVWQIVLCYLIINAITSAACMINGWDGLRHIKKATAASNNALLHFGKYTTFTLIGTNLLRSADMFIISFSSLGSAAVALYSIPLKLTELQQIPLRSFAATAFPKMSRASLQGKTEEVKRLFYTYAGALTYLFIFLSIGSFVFAEQFVLWIAGKQYLQPDPVNGFNAVTIVRIFSLYGLLLPIDRMTGIGLDSINKPGVNAFKVLLMVTANIVGDLLAIFIFKSLVLVAVSSILFTTIGIWIGMKFLNRELTLHYNEIFTQGIQFYKNLFQKNIGGRNAAMVKA